MSAVKLHVEWLKEIDAIEALRERWMALEVSVTDRTVYGTHDFVASWYRGYVGTKYTNFGKPLVGVVLEGSAPVGIAPFFSFKSTLARIPVRALAFAGHNVCAGEVLALDGRVDVFEALLRSLADRAGWDVLILSNMPSATQRLRLYEDAAARTELRWEVTDDRSYAVADLRDGYETYANLRGSNFRKQARRHAKKVADAGIWRIDRLDRTSPPDAVSHYLGRMFAIGEAGWRARERGIDEERGHQPFLRLLVERFAPRGMVDLSILSIDDRDVAFTLALVDRGTYFHVAIAHAEDLADLSPGSFLLQEVFRMLPALGVHLVVSHGDYEYKRRWATDIVHPKEILLFARTLRGTLSHFSKSRLQRTWERVRATARERVGSHRSGSVVSEAREGYGALSSK